MFDEKYDFDVIRLLQGSVETKIWEKLWEFWAKMTTMHNFTRFQNRFSLKFNIPKTLKRNYLQNVNNRIQFCFNYFIANLRHNFQLNHPLPMLR